MGRRFFRSFCLLALLGVCGVLWCAPVPRTLEADIRFRQSKHRLDPDFAGNLKTLRQLADTLGALLNSGHVLEEVTLRGAASPEGPASFNLPLSQRRARAILDWLAPGVAIPDSLLTMQAVGRDWASLKEAVEADPSVPCRPEVLSLLDSIIADGGYVPGQLQSLKELAGGRPYTYLYSNIFPALRNTRLLFRLRPLRLPLPVPEEFVLSVPVSAAGALASLPEPVPLGEWEAPAGSRRFIMGVRTNLLHDAAALPDLGLEFWLGKRWSLAADWTYGWWTDDARHRYWRAYGGAVTLRRWLGRTKVNASQSDRAHKPLRGHHVGLYAGMFTFDFELGGTGRMGGLPGGTLWDRAMLQAGVEYGYSLPIASHINLDFSIGLGYLGGKVIKYAPSPGNPCAGTAKDGYRYLSQKRLNWVGPTRAVVSLEWVL